MAEIFDKTDSLRDRFTGKLERVDGFVVHHTGGRGEVDGVISTFKDRGYPAHYVIDRDGNIYQTLPDWIRGSHTKPGEDFRDSRAPWFSNDNTIGVEIIANDDADVLPVQVQAARELIKQTAAIYGFDPVLDVYGHGEVTPGHKLPTEGLTVASAVRGESMAFVVGPDPFGIRKPKASKAAADALRRSPRILEKGTKGEDVKGLQSALARQGFDPGLVDGYFGDRSLSALQDYQRANGLDPDGIFKGATRWALLALNGAQQRDEETKLAESQKQDAPLPANGDVFSVSKPVLTSPPAPAANPSVPLPRRNPFLDAVVVRPKIGQEYYPPIPRPNPLRNNRGALVPALGRDRKVVASLPDSAAVNELIMSAARAIVEAKQSRRGGGGQGLASRD